MIQSAAKDCRLAPAEKDDTDTELALKIIFQLYPEAEVTIFGALVAELIICYQIYFWSAILI